LTGYTQRYLGYRLKTGQLDLDTKAAIDGGQLDAQNQLALHRLELDLLHPAEQDKLTQELGLPLNTALSLLRDRDGDIRLSIPVQGDLKSPDVSVGDAVRKAMMKGVTAGIKTAAVVFFAPVGAVLAAGKLVGLATALRFEPVLFDPGQTRLNEEARAYLDRLSERLRDRPGVRITLCGVTTDADVSALQQAALAAAARPTTAVPGAGTANTAPVTTLPSEGAAPKTEPNEQSPPKEAGSAPLPEPPPVSRDELLDVGQRRGEVVRDYLVERGRIDSDRLLPCSPQHEEAKEAKSRVDIAL
jgi:outer membrane protein OmpA-like peptidoglycan-associated protein